MEKGNQKNTTKKSNIELYVQITVIVILTIVLAFNAGKIYSSTGVSGKVSLSLSDIIPKGIPAVYGKEMGVSYNDVSPNNPQLADATIAKLTQSENLELKDVQMERYIKIAGSISCEYCCGAKSLILDNGQRACGCAHSYAMRGLAKYLLTKHPEMSDEDILSELGKWKVLFFPEIHEQKAEILESKGIDSKNYINLASNLYRGIEKGQTSGGMVGGC